jgi:hypothetical protein
MKSMLRILHLEDDPRDSEIVESLLIEEGIACELIRVSTRDQFRSAVEQESFDLILADYALPSFDGISALAIALGQPHLPFSVPTKWFDMFPLDSFDMAVDDDVYFAWDDLRKHRDTLSNKAWNRSWPAFAVSCMQPSTS